MLQIVGCGFHRLPAESTVRFTRWANSLDDQQLYHQLYTSHGPTLVMPTWFCARAVFDRLVVVGDDRPNRILLTYKVVRNINHTTQQGFNLIN